MLGRGLVHPLDLQHSENPASHPAVLDLLSDEFVAHQFDIKWLLRELALSRAYQRSSVLSAGLEREPLPEKYVIAIEKPLSTEQLLWSVLQATGELPRYQPLSTNEGRSKPNPQLEELRKRFVAAFANPPRDPEVEFAPSVKAALFLSHDVRVLELLKPKDGNLAAQLIAESDHAKRCDLLFITVLSRTPASEEVQAMEQFLTGRAEQMDRAIGQLIWALISSTEFCVNH
jgi:hypothetical protein